MGIVSSKIRTANISFPSFYNAYSVLATQQTRLWISVLQNFLSTESPGFPRTPSQAWPVTSSYRAMGKCLGKTSTRWCLWYHSPPRAFAYCSSPTFWDYVCYSLLNINCPFSLVYIKAVDYKRKCSIEKNYPIHNNLERTIIKSLR